MRMNYSEQGCTGLVYDGVDLSDVFTVADIEIPLLPTFEGVTQDVPQRAGLYFAYRKIGTRAVKMKLMLNAESRCPVDVFEAWNDVSAILSKPDPRRLYLNGEKYVNAVLIGDTPIEEEGYYGTVELTFMCYDPYVYGSQHEVALSGTTEFNVAGGATYPVLQVTTTSTSVRIDNMETGDYVRVPSIASGRALTIDMEAQRVTNASGEYIAIDLLSDFFPIEGSARIKLTGCTGKLTYRERYL